MKTYASMVQDVKALFYGFLADQDLRLTELSEEEIKKRLNVINAINTNVDDIVKNLAVLRSYDKAFEVANSKDKFVVKEASTKVPAPVVKPIEIKKEVVKPVEVPKPEEKKEEVKVEEPKADEKKEEVKVVPPSPVEVKPEVTPEAEPKKEELLPVVDKKEETVEAPVEEKKEEVKAETTPTDTQAVEELVPPEEKAQGVIPTGPKRMGSDPLPVPPKNQSADLFSVFNTQPLTNGQEDDKPKDLYQRVDNGKVKAILVSTKQIDSLKKSLPQQEKVLNENLKSVEDSAPVTEESIEALTTKAMELYKSGDKAGAEAIMNKINEKNKLLQKVA